ncbi:MAG: helix-turn-helix transcriptional regulator [Candidatus Thiodiazotropha sp.]
MKISKALTDESVLAELGRRVARQRLDLQLTQAEAADQAGISKRTLERIESGASVQLTSLIRLLRVLDDLHGLEQLLPVAGAGPMELLRRQGKPRQRAPRRTARDKANEPWTWGDD